MKILVVVAHPDDVDFGCEVAVSVKSAIADLGSKDIDWLELPRIDTKYFDKFMNGEFD